MDKSATRINKAATRMKIWVIILALAGTIGTAFYGVYIYFNWILNLYELEQATGSYVGDEAFVKTTTYIIFLTVIIIFAIWIICLFFRAQCIMMEDISAIKCALISINAERINSLDEKTTESEKTDVSSDNMSDNTFHWKD